MGNEFDERYDIRIANRGDIEKIMEFINQHWKKGHIMAVSREFFEYEFCVGDRVDFIIAVDKNTDEIECIQGFIPCSKGNDPEKFDVWGSIWKLNETHDNIPLLGIEVCQRMTGMIGARMGLGSGLNTKTALLINQRIFRSKTGKMNHYYMLGDFNEYKIAKIVHRPEKTAPIACPEGISVVKYNTFEEMKKHFDVDSIDSMPYKDSWYFEKRYYRHPVYQYNVYGIVDSGTTKTLLVTRDISHEDRKIARVVDCIGDHSYISYLGDFFEGLLKDGNYEYIDFYEYGVKDEYFRKAGLILREDNDVNIIPNYFEPFVQQNVEVWVSYAFDGTVFFKADADQDRPNSI